MAIDAWLSGVGLGLAVASPVGPVNLLCVRRTLADGWRAGALVGLGASAGDALFGAFVLGGASALSATLAPHAPLLRGAGGALLVALGLALGLAPGPGGGDRDTGTSPRPRARLAAAFGTGLALTLANPLPVLGLATAAALTAGELAPAATWSQIAGLVCGSLAWWLAVVAGVARLRARLGGPSAPTLRGVNRVLGAALVALGVLAIVRS